MLQELSALVPSKFSRYFEPFFGGGALFFHIRPSDAILSDSNPNLISFYEQIIKDPIAVLEGATILANDRETFYRLRSLDWMTLDEITKASLFLYFNRTCYNGLYRVNKRGNFNVPYGQYKSPSFPSRDHIQGVAKMLAKVKLSSRDFRESLKAVHQNDFVFLDPPYLPSGKFSDFKRYTSKTFTLEDHCDLANEMKRLVKIGAFVIATNSDTPMTRELYSDFDMYSIAQRRLISHDPETRTGRDLIISGNKK